MNENTSRIKNSTIGFVVLLLVAAGAWWYYSEPSSYSHALAEGESVSNWNFQGAYTGKPEMEARAREEITRLEENIGNEEDTDTDYSIYVSIANQYHLLGDGTNEYAYLKKALAIDAEITGLAWYNLGNLLSQVGATKSARDAFAQAVRAQPQQINSQSMYLEHLTENFKEDTAAIEAAFTDADKIYGDNATLLEIKARWFESVARYEEAIVVWEKVKTLSPSAAPVIDGEIIRLKAQL